MDRHYIAATPSRGLLAVTGEDRRTFLQGLITNDIRRVADDRAIHAALLTAQGKFLHDFFVYGIGDTIYLEAEGDRVADLKRRLSIYKLRSKVTIDDATERFAVALAFGPDAGAVFDLGEAGAAAPFAGGIVAVDPRHAALGLRILLPRATGIAALEEHGFRPGTPAGYETLRLALGVPDGSRDLIVEKSILLENGFDELNGIDWNKGCYIGQELTARTKYRGLVKKRLMPVRIEGPLPAPGTLIMQGGREAGEIRSGQDGMALALLRLDAVDEPGDLQAGEALIRPAKPDWAKF